MSRQDLGLVKSDKIPDRVLEDASQRPASRVCSVQFEDFCHEIETAQQGTSHITGPD